MRNLESAWRRVEAALASSHLARQNLEAEQRRFEQRMPTSLLVLQADNELTAARSQEVSATVGCDRAVIDYHRAVGNFLERTDIRLVGDEGTGAISLRVAVNRSALGVLLLGALLGGCAGIPQQPAGRPITRDRPPGRRERQARGEGGRLGPRRKQHGLSLAYMRSGSAGDLAPQRPEILCRLVPRQ